MSNFYDVNVDHCVVVLVAKKRYKDGESRSMKSPPFTFQSANCRVIISDGWENDERNICKASLKSETSLVPKFYVTVHVYKGSHSVLYPKKVVLDPSRYIWSASFAEIEKRIPGAEKWNVNFRFIFQTEYEPNPIQKSSGNKSVQTSACVKENSLEKLSYDFGRLLNGAEDSNCDIEMKCGNRVIKAHKAVLASRSEFFRKKLKSLRGHQMELQFIDAESFYVILHYIYAGKLPNWNFETAKKIYKAKDICNAELRELCEDFLIENLTLENACECLTLADEDFKERVIDYIIKEGIPFFGDYWKKFCNEHPESAIDVYDKLVRELGQHKDCLIRDGSSPGTLKKKFLYNSGGQ